MTESYPGKSKDHPNCCISHKFIYAASKTPHKIAVIQSAPVYNADAFSAWAESAPDTCFTFADLSSSIDSFTTRLHHILHNPNHNDYNLVKPTIQHNNDTIKPKVIAIHMVPSVEYIITVLSVLRCGQAFLPLDPFWPRERVFSIINSSNVALLIASQPLWLPGDIACPVLFLSMNESLNRAESDGLPEFVWDCEDEGQREFCYVMYNSESTGKPKGVCGTEQGLLNRFLWMQELYPVVGEQRLAFQTSVGFIDHLQEFLGAVLSSTTLVIPSFTMLKENVTRIINFLEAYSISRFLAVPSMIRAILPILQNRDNSKLQSCLKLVVLSGEPFPVSLWDSLHNLLPETCFLNLYGSTEVSGDCTYFDCSALPTLLKTEKISSVPIGKPISNCKIVLFDGEDKPHEGEILVGGLCLSHGYLNASKESQGFVKLHGNSLCNHLANDCGSQLYYRTGDYCRKLSSGDLIFIGRRDRTVKLHGQRIALEEIETTLELKPDVAEAIVVLNGDQTELD